MGSDHVAILSYGFWSSHFGARSSVLGERIRLNGEMYTVVGVMPRGFDYPSRNDLWRPLTMKADQWAQRGGHYLAGIGRLKPGVSVETAAADLNRIAAHLQQAYPGSNRGWDALLIPLRERVVGKVRPMMLTLLGAVAFVLLIACVNLANLLLSRAAARRKEIGIRGALGASKARLIRQLLTESLVLSAFGTAVGLALAWSGTRLLTHVNAAILPRAAEISLDVRALLVTVAIGVSTGILFGLVPALQMARADLHGSLREGGRGNSMGFRRNWTRSALVTAEVALALVLLSGAALLMRSFYRLESVDTGFDARGLLTFRITLPPARYPKDEQQAAFFQRMLESLRAMPGVASAGGASIFPLSGDNTFGAFTQVGKPPKPPGQSDAAMFYSITPGYFETMRIPLLAGRYFNAADVAGGHDVAIVNRAMVKQFYANENPLGQRIDFGGGPSEIVGVTGDVRDQELEVKERPAIYEPETQAVNSGLYFVLRTTGDPESLIAGARAAVRALDSELPVYAMGTAESVIESTLSQRRFTLLLMAIFAGLALALAMIGIYGVLAYSVSQATQEIGIRVALGAKRGDVLRLVCAYGAGLVGLGVALGIACSLAAGRLLESQLFEVRATDAATYLGVAAALGTAAGAACVIPALRALRVDPIVALRAE